MPLHFLNDNTLAISTRLYSTGQDTTPAASKAGAKRWSLFQSCLSFSVSVSPAWSPSPPLMFPPALPPHTHTPWSNPDLCHLTLMSPRRGPVTPQGHRVGSYVSPFHSNKWTRRSIAHLIGCHESYAISPNSGEPQGPQILVFLAICSIAIKQPCRSEQVSSQSITLFFFRILLEWRPNPFSPVATNVKIKITVVSGKSRSWEIQHSKKIDF